MKRTPRYSFNRCFAKHRAIVKQYKKKNKKNKHLSILFGHTLKKELLKLGIQWLKNYTSVEIDGDNNINQFCSWDLEPLYYARPPTIITLTIYYQGSGNYLKFVVNACTATTKARLKPRNIRIHDNVNKQIIDIHEAYLDTYNCII